MTDAGENAWDIGDKGEENGLNLNLLTSPTPAPIVAENE